MTFGVQCDQPSSFEIMDTAVDHGITFFDTADVYPSGGDLSTVGLTEEIVGNWMSMRGNRDDIVLATKCVGVMGEHRWQRGASRKHIMDAVDASLRRLQTDWIDLYQLHSFDPRTPQEESMSALDDLVRMGKVRYVGCSNHAAWQLARANGVAAAAGLKRFDSIQPRYSLLFRSYEQDLFPLCELDGIAVIPYNPLAGGLLSGKHSMQDGPADNTRFSLGTAADRYQERYWKDAEFATVEALRPIAAEAGLSMVTLANAWVLAQPAVTSPIIGASKPDQLADAVAAVDVTLDDDLLRRLDELTAEYVYAPFV
jgi:aryl-alcohol dehydrogenase (NADP+)